MSTDGATPLPPTIDFWFEFGSNYSYLSVMRIQDAASRAGVRVRWKPFLLGPIFRSFGWETSPFVLQKAKGDYVWQDMDRQCRKAGIPWRKPTTFPRAALLPLRVATLAAEQEWIDAYCRRIMTLNFAEDRAIDVPDVVEEVLLELGLPARQILNDAQADANKLKLRQQTETAQVRGIFGAPTFFVGDEMFWGDDRLDDALVACRSAPPRG
jgi:2-hydroxychromene-2-carboxylate isomerase